MAARPRGERGGGPFPRPPPPALSPALRTRGFGRCRRNPLEAEVRSIFGAVHPDPVPLAVAPPQHGERQGVLQQALDGALQRPGTVRSEEHTSELQSLAYLVCRLLLEKKKK